MDIKTGDGWVGVRVGDAIDAHLQWNNPFKYGSFGLQAEWDEYDVSAYCSLACVSARITVILKDFDTSAGVWHVLMDEDAPNDEKTASNEE